MTTKSGYGQKEGKQKGKEQGGRGRNQTTQCRHPEVRKKR